MPHFITALGASHNSSHGHFDILPTPTGWAVYDRATWAGLGEARELESAYSIAEEAADEWATNNARTL